MEREREKIEFWSNGMESNSDSAVSKGKYLGVKCYAHHLNHSSILMSSFNSIRHSNCEPSICHCERVFFLLLAWSLCMWVAGFDHSLPIRRKNDLLFVDILCLIHLLSSPPVLRSFHYDRFKTARSCSIVRRCAIQLPKSNTDGGENKRKTATNWQAIE